MKRTSSDTVLCPSEEAGEKIRAWNRRLAAKPCEVGVNALTVDVEDYFQVEAFSGVIDRRNWDGQECRVEKNVDYILQMFSDAGVSATFFTLGWIAERYPSLVRRIVACGHELASHGLAHYRADSQDRQAFLQDVTRAKTILECVSGVRVNGYRAASFSINQRNIWAFEILAQAGYRYSSSLYPARYIQAAPQFAFHPLPNSDFMEIPIISVQRFGFNWPCGGGGFFRFFPYCLSAQNIRLATQRDKKTCVFYFHPWEIDLHQPRVAGAPLRSRVRHYTNIRKMPSRLTRLLSEFRWARLDRVLPALAS